MRSPKTTARDTIRNTAASPPPAVPRPVRARAKRPAAAVDPAPVPQLPEDEIRLRAYFRSLERGHAGADPVRDWLEAEQELAARMAVERGAPVVARRRRTAGD